MSQIFTLKCEHRGVRATPEKSKRKQAAVPRSADDRYVAHKVWYRM